jgi:plastocyanin
VRARNWPRLRLMAAAPALALVVAACSAAAGAGGPGASLGPGPSPSAAATIGMTMSPPASGAVASAVPASSGPTLPVPSPLGGGATGSPLHISAQNIAFDTNHLEAAAGQAFTLEFDNNDPGIPHNVEIKDASGASLFKGQIITGPAKAAYQIPALAAGSYTFVCDVHPNMTGTLVVS